MDNCVLPFQIEDRPVRGRLVRLGSVAHDILSRHDYPDVFKALLGESLVVTAALASTLKFDGIFTFQIQGNGALELLVVNATSQGGLRGYIKYNEDLYKKLKNKKNVGLKELTGTGYLAFTVDQGEDMDRYQGIVEITQDHLGDCVRHYFDQSEQLDTGLCVACDQEGSQWRAAAIILQRMPTAAGNDNIPDETQEDDWQRSVVLMNSATEAELLASNLEPSSLLFRLFHEDGVRIFQETDLHPHCQCSRERIDGILKALSADELKEMKEDDDCVTVTCQFCNKDYIFTDADLANLE